MFIAQIPVLVSAFQRPLKLDDAFEPIVWRLEQVEEKAGGSDQGFLLHDAVGRAFQAGIPLVLVPHVAHMGQRPDPLSDVDEGQDSLRGLSGRVMQEASECVIAAMSAAKCPCLFSVQNMNPGSLDFML